MMNNAAIKADCADKMQRYDVRPPNPRLPARNFSGGNQQKIVVAREMDREPDLLLVGQPTRGVDIGAIEFIHQQIVAAARSGQGDPCWSAWNLTKSSASPTASLVMFDGQMMGERMADQTDEAELGLMMAGMTKGAA